MADPLTHYARLMDRELCRRGASESRVVAVCASGAQSAADRVMGDYTATLLAGHGFHALPCDLGDLVSRRERIHLGEHRVDIVWRFVNIEEVDTEIAGRPVADLLEPIVAAHETDAVTIFTPFDGRSSAARPRSPC